MRNVNEKCKASIFSLQSDLVNHARIRSTACRGKCECTHALSNQRLGIISCYFQLWKKFSKLKNTEIFFKIWRTPWQLKTKTYPTLKLAAFKLPKARLPNDGCSNVVLIVKGGLSQRLSLPCWPPYRVIAA